MSKTDKGPLVLSPQAEDAIGTVETLMAEVAAVRDRLDEAIGDLEALRQSCSDAYDALYSARNSLSELV